MRRESFTFETEPRGELYERVLTIALDRCAILGLVISHVDAISSTQQRVLDDLSPFLVESASVREWPGNRLAEGLVARRDLYRYEPAVKTVALLHADGLFDWCSPELPDDFHLLRADRSPWLGSICTEGDAWLELDPSEFDQLRVDAPDIISTIRPDPLRTASSNGG
jgi:hypothetical protein